LESIVRKCLQPDPAQRYQRAEHLAEDLSRLLADQPLKYAPELSRAERVRKWIRRHPRLASSGVVAMAAVLLLAAGGTILHATQTRLAATQARAYVAEGAAAQQRRLEFERGTLQALCLVNTHSDLAEHAAQGREVCEQTLALYGVLENPAWQRHPAWQRLRAEEQRRLAEDVRELLLLLAGARLRLAAGKAAGGDANYPPAVLREAVALLDRAEAVAGLPPSAAVWQAKRDYLKQLGDETAARAADERARAIPPASARDHYLLARAHLQRGGPDGHRQAIQELDQAVRLYPRHYWSWMQKGLCHLEAGELHQALADFGVCVGLWPEFAWGYFNRGFALDRLGDKTAAVADYTAALQRDPTLAAAFQNRGVAELELRQYPAALADFDQVTALGRQGPALHGLRGQALEALGRHAEADAAFAACFAHWSSLSERDRNPLSCAYGFAVCGRLPDQAEHAFRAIPPRDPKYADACYGRGLLAVNRAQPEEALQHFAEALAARPGFEEAHRYRAVLQARQGRIPEAVAEINEALRAAPKSGATLYAAACVTALASQQADSPPAARQAADEALRFLRQALQRGYGQPATDDPDLAGLRDSPEFQRLMAAVPSK
jgi:tetratricopeptide (TPR) repeat protein